MRFFFSITVLFMILSLMVVSPVMAGKTITLTYSNLFPPMHAINKDVEAWAKEIEKRTNGQVKITIFPGGTLTPSPQIYDGVVKGVSDLGMPCLSHTPGRFPVMEATDLPIGMGTGRVASHAINEFYRIVLPKELSNSKVLYLHSPPNSLIHTATKPIRKMEEMKGLRLRGTGLSAELAKLMGATPVAMPQIQVYESLKKGVIDGTLTTYECLEGWKQGEVVKYSTEAYNIGWAAVIACVMNLEKFNSLPRDIQKVFLDVSEEWVDVHGKTWLRIEESGKNWTLKHGGSVINLSEEEKTKFYNAVQPRIADYIEARNKEGLPGQDYVDLIRRLSVKYNKMFE
ncbi:MAG: TRAP transporter substrate-binding protein [Pseudomonadota bacterium]